MKPTAPKVSPIKKYQFINLGLFIAILGLAFFNLAYSSLTLAKINTAKQQITLEAVSRQSAADQELFFQSQPALIAAIDLALPSQTDLVNLVTTIENLGTQTNTGLTFAFSSLVPMQESNQYYLPFSLRFNASFPQMLDFLRRFEKLPYLTKLNSFSAKSPNGLSGLLEVSLSGRVYVQDNYKN